MHTIFLAILVVLLAYFVKGFSGFGPALVLVPSLTLLFDPETAISASTFFDIIAGPVLLYSVRKQIDWKFVVPVNLLIFTGAYFGAHMLKIVSAGLLTKIIGFGLLGFIVLLLFQSSNESQKSNPSKLVHWISLPIALIAGFSGGMIGITGPLLVIYMKLNFDKSYFRNQLIAIFTFGAIWRFFLYRWNGTAFNMDLWLIIVLSVMLFAGLWIGQHVHARVNEKTFNRVIALVLIVPVINLLLFK
jgi:uncharacterized membrane protein YfcA